MLTKVRPFLQVTQVDAAAAPATQEAEVPSGGRSTAAAVNELSTPAAADHPRKKVSPASRPMASCQWTAAGVNYGDESLSYTLLLVGSRGV